jgi:hypothetical protein
MPDWLFVAAVCVWAIAVYFGATWLMQREEERPARFDDLNRDRIGFHPSRGHSSR